MDIDKIIEADGSIYRTHFSDSDISLSYRLLSLKEYRVFKSLRDGGLLPPYILNEMVFERCYLGNPLLINKDILAGITISIGGLIMYLSGDCDQETLIQDIQAARAHYPSDTVFEYMRSAVITAFPTTTIDTIESLTRMQFLRHFVIAENILSKQNSEYEKLALKDIKDSAQGKPQGANINFQKENREIKKAMGHWNNEEAEAQHKQESRKKLSKKQLSELDNRNR